MQFLTHRQFCANKQGLVTDHLAICNPHQASKPALRPESSFLLPRPGNLTKVLSNCSSACRQVHIEQQSTLQSHQKEVLQTINSDSQLSN